MTAEPTPPRIGMFATIRNRRGVVSAVEAFDGDSGRLHLVHLEYKDDQLPHEEQLLWELEPRGRLLEPTALPSATASDSMEGEGFDALRCTRAVPVGLLDAGEETRDMTPGKSGTQFLFKVNMKGARRIWRTIALRGDQTLDDLHEAIFEAFDRDDPHLYSFYIPKAPGRGSRSGPQPKEYTAPPMFDDSDPFGAENQINAAKARLDELKLKTGQRFEYLFDFGDSWWHEVLVETISPVAPGTRYGVLEKKGTSPPQYEDVDE